MKISSLISVAIIFFLFLLYNNTLVLHPATALTDWLDYPLIVFILEQNITHFSKLDFANIGTISSFYPSPNGMFFTETLFLQGLVGTVVFPFTQNYILTHNILFFLTALLNICSLQYFWGKLFKQKAIVFVLSLLFTFSPFYFSMYVHFQMISYAFFFFAAGRLLTAKALRDFFVVGLLSGLQFLSSVYVGMYSLTFTGLYLIWELWRSKQLVTVFKQGCFYILGFTIVAGFVVYKYATTKAHYNIERDAGFYVDLAIQPTDIIFNPYPSIWSKTIYEHVNQFNARKGPRFGTGWLLLATALLGIYSSRRQKNQRQSLAVFMLFLGGWGIIAALGPRLTWNGTYLATPLPYLLVLKFTPLFDALRATGRWFFVVQISLFYFVGIFLMRVLKNASRKEIAFTLVIGIMLYTFEMLPLEQRTAVESYQSYAYQPLVEHCTATDVLLEYPFGILKPDSDVGAILNYWVKMLLNQMHHDCMIVNGYSGYDPEHYLIFRDRFESLTDNGSVEELNKLTLTKDVSFIKINKMMLEQLAIPTTLTRLVHSEQFEILLEDDNYLVARRKKL